MKKPGKLPSNDIKKAAEILKKGGIVLFPTDTVYGIGCLWDDKSAKEKIYAIKSRPPKIPFPVLLTDSSQLSNLAQTTPYLAKLIKKYWPGGLTIIIKTKKGIKTGFRVPDNNIVRELIKAAGKPIVGTSANIHGKKPVSDFKDLDPQIVKQVDFVLKGRCPKGKESTVIDLSGKSPKIIRRGAVVVKSYLLSIDTTVREKVDLKLKDKISSNIFKQSITQQTGSQALIPGIISILKKHKLDIQDIDEINVATGPGSFTGTRVGVAVANALGYALDIPVNGEIDKIVLPVYEKSKFD